MADHTEDALIREVNDELREEQMKQLWSRYGGYVVGAAILVVAIVAGYQGWKHYTTSARMAEGERYYAASQMAAGDPQGAIAELRAMGAEATTGYGVLAQFQEAALMAGAGDVPGAAALYRKIAKETTADTAISGLAIVLGTTLELNAGGYDRAALELRLSAISGPNHPYLYSARELLALIALNAGDTDKARTYFAELAVDAAAPKSMTLRARDILQTLGAD